MGYLKKQITTFHVLDGKRVPASTAGAVVKRVESKKWYGVITVQGKKISRPLHREKRKAEQLLNAWELGVLKGELGLNDPFEEHKARPVGQHVREYLQALTETGAGPRHQKDCRRQLLTLLIDLGILETATGTWKGEITDSKPMGDLLDADRVQAVDNLLAAMGGMAGRTKNTYRGAIVRFVNFLVAKKRLPSNPFNDVTKADESQKRRQRRAESKENIVKLLTAARTRPLVKLQTIYKGKRQGQQAAKVKPAVEARLLRDGMARAMLYKGAVLTGLRADELRELRVNFLDLDAPLPVLEVPGRVTKNGQDATFLLRPDFVDDLREWVRTTGLKDGDRLFHVPTNYLRFFKKDLKFAGIEYRDAKGRYFDFHALRKTCNVFLGRGGISPALRQKYMRHSDIRLTLGTYDDAEQYEQGMILDALPDLPIRNQAG